MLCSVSLFTFVRAQALKVPEFPQLERNLDLIEEVLEGEVERYGKTMGKADPVGDTVGYFEVSRSASSSGLSRSMGRMTI